MEMNYFRNILIVPTSLNKQIDTSIHGVFFAPCLNSINQLVKRGRGTGGASLCGLCVQSSGLFIYYFASCEIVFNFLNQITAKPKRATSRGDFKNLKHLQASVKSVRFCALCFALANQHSLIEHKWHPISMEKSYPTLTLILTRLDSALAHAFGTGRETETHWTRID